MLILGGGPGGVAAGVYAARKKISAALVAESFGGQSTVSATVENWIGEISIKGPDLKRKLEEHIRFFEKSGDLDVYQPLRITAVDYADEIFSLRAADGSVLHAKALLVATGARHRRLGIPGEEELVGRGVVYCSTCDAPMFRGKDVVVVGTGNSGLEAVEDLLPYARRIYLLGITEEITGDAVTWERIKSRRDDIEVILRAKPKEIKGEGLVSELIYTDLNEERDKSLPVGGVFVEIGTEPNSELFSDLVKTDRYGQIIVDIAGRTSHEAIFAAGDVTNVPYKQNNIAAGEAIKALLSAYEYLKQK